MDVQKLATYGTAAAVVGTGSIVGGNVALDHATGGPEKRVEAEATELRVIVREEVRSAFAEMWPTKTGPVTGTPQPTGNYKNKIPK